MSAILEIQALTKNYQGILAVKDLNFTIENNEILGLIGPNGAGKTTLVNLISGTTLPSKGKILFENHSIENLPAYKRSLLGIARTFQIMRPFPGLSVLENVAVGALFGTSPGVSKIVEAEQEAQKCLEVVGLTGEASHRADSLNGPGRKRLELAKALAMRPKLLLLDEVMAGLNHVEIQEIVSLIKKVRDQGITILVIEHVLPAIKNLADRLLVLHHGMELALGKTEEVLQDPKVIEAYLGKKRE